jgi:hypothetical protein
VSGALALIPLAAACAVVAVVLPRLVRRAPRGRHLR